MRILAIFITFIAYLSCSIYAQAQQLSRWQDHFNYNRVNDILISQSSMIGVSEFGLFSYNLNNQELQKISKANVLRGVHVTAAEIAVERDELIVGFRDGSLNIVQNGQTSLFVEIPIDEYQGDKSIRHLDSQGDRLIITAEYGISIFDLVQQEFSETTFFSTGNLQVTPNQSVVLGNRIFTATQNGIFSHEINNLLPDFSQWNTENVPQTDFRLIEVFRDGLVAAQGGSLYRYQNGNWQMLGDYGYIHAFYATENTLLLSSAYGIFRFNANMQSVQQYNTQHAAISVAEVNGSIFYGTETNGIIQVGSNARIYPDGPFSNNAYAVAALNGQIWVSPGGQANFNQPMGNNQGYFHYNSREWLHITNDRLDNALDIIHITPNPNDSTEIYISTWHEIAGVLRMRSNVLQEHYQENNSSLVPITRIGGSALQQNGDLWVTQSFANGGFNFLHRKTAAGQWTAFDLSAYDLFPAAGVRVPFVTNNGWILVPGTRGDGLIVTNGNDFYLIHSGEGQGNLPSNLVYKAIIDNNGNGWIGTSLGLRVKFNIISELQSGNYATQPVVIVQDGIPEALLMNTPVYDIEIDNSNQKWLATGGAGVFYLSANGREIIHHFTAENSPLSDNTVFDIDIDHQTGRVFFATASGLVSYAGDVVSSGDSFAEVVAYPNPVRPHWQGDITIKGLANNADVRITDITGNLLYRQRAQGGVVKWNGQNFKGQRVASGIYLVLMTNQDGSEQMATKIAIIR
ncbi:MAG: T9SS type A sorting domain-containing protein [Weeksellaceae bacterium]|nr:T9SS type A sorting domain-containing protein [Weeksellaceae bacterium]